MIWERDRRSCYLYRPHDGDTSSQGKQEQG